MTTEDISFTDFIASSIHDMKNSLNVQVNGLETIAAACRAQGDSSTLEGLGPIIHQAHRMNANLIQLLSLYKLAVFAPLRWPGWGITSSDPSAC